MEEDPELKRAEKEHERKLVEIENDDGPTGSEPDQSMDHPSDDARGTKGKTEDEGEHELTRDNHEAVMRRDTTLPKQRGQ